MRQAYLIMAHNNFEQLNTLLMMLDDERNDIFLHVDARAADFDGASARAAVNHARLVFIPRMKPTWGGYSLVACQMNLLKAAISAGDHGYYHLISGADLPIQSNDRIIAFFDAHQGREFIHFTNRQDAGNLDDEVRRRISVYHPFQNLVGRWGIRLNGLVESGQEACGINRLTGSRFEGHLGKGSNWFSITHDFAQYLVGHRGEIESTFSSGFCADELVIQTMVLASPFKDRIYHEDADDDYASIMRHVDWKRGAPYVFRSADFDGLVHSGMMFARKFDARVDNEIILRLAAYVTE